MIVKSLNIACVGVFVLLACALRAQTYQVGPNGTTQAPDEKKQSQPQQLGWGSNIQNARLARAAELALQRGDRAQALEYAQRATQAAPNDPQLWFLLGYAARLNGKTQESIDAYNHGLQLNPKSLDGLSGLAQTDSVAGKNEEAARLLKQVLSADPRRTNDALVLGDIYMRQADYTSALDALNRAERAHPDARPELLMAMCYEHLKRMDMANRYFDMAKRHAPDNPEVQRSLAGYFREVGKYNDAISALKSIRNPKPEIVAELAYTYQLDGKPDESARLYAQAANAVPKDLALQLSAAQAEVAAGSLDQELVSPARGADRSESLPPARNSRRTRAHERPRLAGHQGIRKRPGKPARRSLRRPAVWHSTAHGPDGPLQTRSQSECGRSAIENRPGSNQSHE